MNTKILVALTLILSIQSNVFAQCKLWNGKIGNYWVVCATDECASVEYKRGIDSIIDDVIEPVSTTSTRFNWVIPNPEIEAKGLEIRAAMKPVKILKATPSKSLDKKRPARKMDGITKTKIRLPDSTECEGDKIKHYRKNDSWFKAKGFQLTIRCGMHD